MPGSGNTGVYTLWKILNGFAQIIPFWLQFISMYLLYDLAVSRLCERTGVTNSNFVLKPGAGTAVDPTTLRLKSEHFGRGMFHCPEIVDEPGVVAAIFAAVFLACLIYSLATLLRGTRHSRFGTLDYLCYIDVSKTEGSWAFLGFKGTAVLALFFSLTALGGGVIILAARGANFLEYADLVVQWGLRTSPAAWAAYTLLGYQTVVNGKQHSRFARYVIPDVHLYYPWWRNSKYSLRNLQDIVSLDPLLAEAILVEATYIVRDSNWSGKAKTRVQAIHELLTEGVQSTKLLGATWWPLDWLGGNMHHIDANMMASIGKAGENADPAWLGKDGEDMRGLYSPAMSYNDGFDYPPKDDTEPRAQSAQFRFRELLYFFGDSHVRYGLHGGGKSWLTRPDAAKGRGKPWSVGKDGMCEAHVLPVESWNVREPEESTLIPKKKYKYGGMQTSRSTLLSWRV